MDHSSRRSLQIKGYVTVNELVSFYRRYYPIVAMSYPAEMRQVHMGRYPKFVQVGGQYRVPREDVIAYLLSKGQNLEEGGLTAPQIEAALAEEPPHEDPVPPGKFEVAPPQPAEPQKAEIFDGPQIVPPVVVVPPRGRPPLTSEQLAAANKPAPKPDPNAPTLTRKKVEPIKPEEAPIPKEPGFAPGEVSPNLAGYYRDEYLALPEIAITPDPEDAT